MNRGNTSSRVVMRLQFIFILLFFCCFISTAQQGEALPGDLKFKHFTSANGLSQRSVMAIVQDKTGYLWFGTRDGLNKFDGQKFIVYRHIATDDASLSNNNVHSIYEDDYGNLWIGTQAGLNRYNPRTDNFTRYRLPKQGPGGPDAVVRNIIQVNSDLLWAATDDGIIQIHIKSNRIERIIKPDGSNALSNKSTRYFLKTKDGAVWICNTQFIDVYNLAKKTFRRIPYPRKSSNNIHFNDLPTLYIDRKNTIWLGYEQGLAVYNAQTGIFNDFEMNGKIAVSSAVRSICEDLTGNLWIGSYGGLYILNAAHSKISHIVHDDNSATSLSQNSIYKVIRDSRGDMWLGTWADGLNYYNKDIGAFKSISFGNVPGKLNYKVVSGIAEDLQGKLWIGTEGGGLNVYDKNSQRFSYFKHEPDNPHSLAANNVKSVITAGNGRIWLGMHDGGVDVLDPSQQPFRFKKIDFSAPGAIPLKGYKVLTLLEDRNENIWIGTLTGGLCFYDTRKQELTKTDNDIKTVMSIAQTADPEVLAIGGDNGLETINIRTKKRVKIPLEQIVKRNTSLYVNCIFIDAFNIYWIGTEGNGVFMYDPERNEAKVYGTGEGLPNDIVYGILSDETGNIWLSTNNGISRLEISSGKVKNFNQQDGLQGNEFNYGSFFKSRSGELYFGGINGLTYFNPAAIKKNNFVPVIDIANLEVNNMPYLRITDAIPEVSLSYNQNNFSIDFTALNYMYPEKSEFAYKLEGMDRDWIYVKNERRAVYTNIPAGNYIFKVKGANSDGVWNEEGDELTIKVQPAPWLTWWAYAIYTAILLAVALYIRKLIVLRVRERRETERIEQRNRMKLSLFSDISHDFRTPLTLIVGPLKEMLDKDEGDAHIKQQHAVMYRNAGMLLQLINEVLDFTKMESNAQKLEASQANLVHFVEDIKMSFDALAATRNIGFDLIVENDIPEIWFDQVLIRKVLFNLLANAFKFTNAGKCVTIKISSTGDQQAAFKNYVAIDVINFGNVLSADQMARIFDPFYQLDHKNKHQGSGLGLSLVKKLVELHKGAVTVKSSAEQGTCFTVFLKQGYQHFSKNERAGRPNYSLDDLMVDAIAGDYKALNDEPGIQTEGAIAVQDRPLLLIVEDNADVLQFIRQIFIDSCNVLTAGNGDEALLLAAKYPVDLIISDVEMPVMNGFEVCNAIKGNLITSHIFVILLTAKTSPGHQQKGYSIGADSYITKPFDANILRIHVANLLKTRANLALKFKKDAILEPGKLNLSSPDEIFLEKAIALVEENIENPEFNANMFVAKMFMSRTVLYTKLKALTGQNISTFIRTVRLKKAAQFILYSNKTISQIAFDAGFNDLKYFRESFKELFNLTPSEYKKQKSPDRSANDENKPDTAS